MTSEREVEPASAVVELEIGALDLRYGHLRIEEVTGIARLAASLLEHGQQSPVLVVSGERAGEHVLIDGYRRVAALRSLARDLVRAVVLPLGEADALVLSHRLETSRRRSALEQAWLVRELLDRHGKSQSVLAVEIGRSTSWVSRRLALVRELPGPVQERVRRGQLCAHGAMRYLVPLARANAAQCQQLVGNLEGERLSARRMEQLYRAWRGADATGRARIATHPLVMLRAHDEMMREPAASPDEQALVRDLAMLGSIGLRAQRRLREAGRERPRLIESQAVQRAWRQARTSIEGLGEQLRAERHDGAGPGHASGDSSAPS